MYIKKGWVFLVISMITPISYGYSDKINHCPKVEQVYNLAMSLKLIAYNGEGRFFANDAVACGYCDFQLKAVKFIPPSSHYNKASKTLACAYEIRNDFSDDSNIEILKNVGDY